MIIVQNITYVKQDELKRTDDEQKDLKHAGTHRICLRLILVLTAIYV